MGTGDCTDEGLCQFHLVSPNMFCNYSLSIHIIIKLNVTLPLGGVIPQKFCIHQFKCEKVIFTWIVCSSLGVHLLLKGYYVTTRGYGKSIHREHFPRLLNHKLLKCLRHKFSFREGGNRWIYRIPGPTEVTWRRTKFYRPGVYNACLLKKKIKLQLCLSSK